ncbi:TonB-dependent receptor [Methyloversatilis sp. XJ19-13]|uniref:TonB-dependent receptor n=1 Tax=Methyloversatilis sp. XJ19-13 TaxID=2963430 RepID=UPI00211BA26D|nr:TonB-dependent receptor [Methyloversatilis sp. XJ19-13]MCQ9373034.1 TonB-dependent receptor [Methyloversatilis sp. XJ19-13]
MTRTALSLAVASALSSISLGLQAADPAIVIGEVTIRAPKHGPLLSTQVLSSVDILGSDKVQDKTVMNSWELLGQMPGMQLTETRMGAESGKVTFRAFNGEGYINGIKVLIDGIPSNVNSGNQRFIDMIFPLEIDYIEVVRGTNDPRYGLHNIGGNINIATRQGGNYLDGRLTYGSFNTREAQLAVGRESNGFSQNYFFAKQDSDGYRDHSESEKYTFGAKWFVTSADGAVKTGLIVRAYNHQAEEPGFLTAAELAASRRQSSAKNANDRDDRDMSQISAHLDWAITPTAFLSNKLYFNTYKDDRQVTFSGNPVGTAPRQRRIWDEHQFGLMSTLTWRANELITVDGGLNVERQKNEYRRFRYPFAVPTDFSTPTFVQNYDVYSLNNVGAYVQTIITPTESLKIIPGYRLDRFSGDTLIRTSGVSADLQDTGWIDQPKLSVVYSLTPNLSVYANWGRTFQVLTGSRAPAYLTPGQSEFRPSINTGREVGVKLAPTAGIDMRVAVWQQDATDEVANMPSTGTTVGLGETRRRGVDLQFSGRLTDRLEVWLSHSVQEAKVISAFTSTGTSLAGKEVFSTPRFISNVGAEYRLSEVWRFGLQGRAQGDYYIDDLNAQGKFGGFVLFDANVRYTMSRTASLDLQVRNIADRDFEYVWYDNFFFPAGSHQPSFSPGPGRAAYLSLNLKL